MTPLRQLLEQIPESFIGDTRSVRHSIVRVLISMVNDEILDKPLMHGRDLYVYNFVSEIANSEILVRSYSRELLPLATWLNTLK
jgi:hypothetical protein